MTDTSYSSHFTEFVILSTCLDQRTELSTYAFTHNSPSTTYTLLFHFTVDVGFSTALLRYMQRQRLFLNLLNCHGFFMAETFF
jgi:hypothetical protein